MKTQLQITIEHPDDMSAESFIQYTLRPLLSEINMDMEDEWFIYTTVTEEAGS